MIMKTLCGIAVVAAVATAGDYIWYTVGVRHTMTAGLVHGAVLLTAVGGVIGWAAGRTVKGLPIGTLAGLGGAASYYLFVAVMDRRTYGTAIPAAWVVMWLLLAALEGRWLRAPSHRSWGAIAVRGAAAAVLGGIAFYLVMNVLWGRPPAGGRNYGVQFLAWAFAWTPGLLALMTGGAPAVWATRTVSSESASGRPLTAASGSRRTEASTAVDTDKVQGSISAGELLARIERGEPVLVLDVRSEMEFTAGHVPGAVNVPFNLVPSRMDEVPGAPGDELIVYCGHGPRAYIAAVPLRTSGGRRVVFMSGHWSGWQREGLREER